MKDSYALHQLSLVYQQDENEKRIILKNKKIQKNINDLFKDVKIIKKEILN